jgi:hypothetical protein
MRWLVFVFVLSGSAAFAQDTHTRTERYGTTIAIIDGASAAMLAGGITLIATHDSGGLRVVGILATIAGSATYVWGSPIVHHLRDRPVLSKSDIALRVAVPGLFAGLGAAITQCDDPPCGRQRTAALIGGGAGILLVSALDIAIFAKQDVVIPYAAPVATGGVVGVAGRF